VNILGILKIPVYPMRVLAHFGKTKSALDSGVSRTENVKL